MLTHDSVFTDVALLTLDEAFEKNLANRVWGRELRARMSDLVNSRLASRITLEEYKASRHEVDRELAECHRRRDVLAAEIASRQAQMNRGVDLQPARTAA